MIYCRNMRWVLAAILSTTVAFAPTGPIATYTFSGTATGTWDDVPFTNAPFTVTGTGPTSSVTCGGGTCTLNFPPGTTTFTINGNPGTFGNGAYFFVNQTSTLNGTPAGLVGFGPGFDIIQIYGALIGSSAFTTYNLQTSIGPLGPQATDPAVGSWVSVFTDGGPLTVTSFTNFTFQGTVAGTPPPATPVPSSLLLLGVGLACLAAWKFRSRVFARS
jgi:hypothetical protein